MAFDTIASGEYMESANVQQIIDALTGVSGGGQQIQLTQLNDASNYALTIKNLDTSNGYALKVTDAADAVLIQAYKNNLQLGASAANDSLAINAKISGKVYVGVASANAGMTTGILIDQSTADNQILALASTTDVAHGMTTLTGSDGTAIYGMFAKVAGGTGGLEITGLTEATVGLLLYGIGVTDDTTSPRALTSRGYIEMWAGKKSGTTAGAPGADSNLLCVRSSSVGTRFVLDSDGDSHQDVGTAWTNFDEHDDVMLLNLLSAHVARHDDPLRQNFGEWLAKSRAPLQNARIVSFNEDGHHFVNMSRLTMLHTGAIRQMAERLELAESKLAALPQGAR